MKYLILFIILSFLFTSKASAELISIVSRESTIKEKIESNFEDPRMMDVVHCESGNKANYARQFDSRGKPLMSLTSDVGVMQINQVHWRRAKSLGLDIFYSVDDNIKMGKIVYEEQGIEAWVCNRKV